MKRTPLIRKTRIRPVNQERRKLRYAETFGTWADTIRELPCMTCGARPPSDPSHTRSRSIGGLAKDLVPQCRACHTYHEEHPDELKRLRPMAAVLWAVGQRGGLT